MSEAILGLLDIEGGGFQNIQGRQIRKENVDDFWAQLKARLAASRGG